MNAGKSSVKSVAAVGVSSARGGGVSLPSDGDLLLITDPCFTDKMHA